MSNVDGIISENIKETIAPGLAVYDLEGKKVGSVHSIDRETGWFTVSTSAFSHKELYIPFSLITSIDPRELFLSRSKEELQTANGAPPARSSMVEDIDGTSSAVTNEPSGYDGASIVVERVGIDQLKTQIVVGSHVYSSDMKNLGKIKTYDAGRGVMTVESGIFSKHDLLVPVTVVDYVDKASHDVYLSYAQADLERTQNADTVSARVVKADSEAKDSK